MDFEVEAFRAELFSYQRREVHRVEVGVGLTQEKVLEVALERVFIAFMEFFSECLLDNFSSRDKLGVQKW